MKPTAILLLTALCPAVARATVPSGELDALGVAVTGTSRAFAYTNGQTAFYYGETNAANTTGWQGFNVFGHECMDDYLLVVDGTVLRREDAIATTVYPDHLVREYPGGIVEQLRPLDSLAALGVLVTAKRPISLQFVPLFADVVSGEDFLVEREGGTALISRRHLRPQADGRNVPAWLAVQGRGFTATEEAMREGSRSGPVTLASERGKTHILAFAAAATRERARAEAKAFVDDPARWFRLRRNRMERLLARSAVRTDDARFDRALAWAKLSLDALMMNQVTRGIFAGLPWFNNYWGRDTFIALPGACLVTGRFEEAKAILRSFAAFQQTDPASPDYGRIPNIITTTDRAYNTADGTPRFVVTAHDYVLRSGDTAFVREIYPVIRRSIEGTMRHHMDSLGFLVHGDAETWMDAVGPDGPWSPRGNRANDIQALWAGQLESGAWFAGRFGDTVSATAWNKTREKLARSFPSFFLAGGSVADHLRPDGTPDRLLRPNQLFAAPLLPPEQRREMVRNVTEKLAYEHGVASLWQEEDNFHPYHVYDPYYPKDAAYHNGIVWTWVQGALISELCRAGNQGTAFRITANSVHQILDRGAVGTQSELLDALARPGETEPRLSGTFSQAWNLAEFIRNFYDDYLGARITRIDHRLVLRPRLPGALGNVRAVLGLNGRSVPIQITSSERGRTVEIDTRDLQTPGEALIHFPGEPGSELEVTVVIPPRSHLKLTFKDGEITCYQKNNKRQSLVRSKRWIPVDTAAGIQLAVPRLRGELRSLRGPDYLLLSHLLVRRKDSGSRPVLDVSDPAGDDKGIRPDGSSAGTYTYPRNAHFVPGCLDLTGFRVSEDDSLVYFRLQLRGLSNPGWHPQYGFQLTYVAMALDLDGRAGSGARVVPRNSGCVLPPERAYERLILVGGGVRVEDADGNVLAAYVPREADATDPIGNTGERTISFALPRALVPAGGRWTVLVGAQDDHGGSGLGEFRGIQPEAGEWVGGGKQNPGDPNVYDALVTGP